MCGVHFMAETAKILNPRQESIDTDMSPGCPFAESNYRRGRKTFKTKISLSSVVSYVNTSKADVKAETDICCTSS